MAKKNAAPKKVTLRLLPDVPVGEGIGENSDGLRFEQYAQILGRVALDTPEPFTIGVYGGWGSGKTSLMRMISQVAEDEEDAIPVWFNAWRYEKEEHLIIPLLATIITEIDKNKSRLSEAVKDGTKKIRDAFRGILYGVSVKGKVGVPGLTEAELSVSPKDMIDRYEKLSEMATEQILDQSLYFRSFSRLDEITKEVKGARLVVFIDDLDRCFPDKAVALLENIKLVLNQPNIAFVLGIAPKIIQAYLKAKYMKDYGIEEKLYEDYLDKLVQLPFQIPDIKDNVEDYARGLLKRTEVFGQIAPDVFEEEYEPLVSICGPACMDNPRAIIRFLNRLLLLKRVHEEKRASGQKKISLVHFGITNALQMKWPKVLSACERNRDIPAKEKKGIRASETKPAYEYESLCDLLDIIFKDGVDDATIISKLEEIAGIDQNPEKDAFRILATNDSLRALLNSKPGKEWLTKPKLRKAATVTTKEVKTVNKDSDVHKYEVPWADGYDSDGWPICRGHAIRPQANLMNVKLVNTILTDANLWAANMTNTNLWSAVLTNANLTSANLTNANLKNANLVNAKMGGVYLRDANLRSAKLQGANLESANLAGVDLRSANLEGANLTGAMYNSETVWPKGFDPEAYGAIRVPDDPLP